MPIYRITNRATGKTIRVNSQGSIAPDQAQAKDLFDQYNRSQQSQTSVAPTTTPTTPVSTTPTTPTTETPSDALDTILGTAGGIARLGTDIAGSLAPRARQFITQDYPKYFSEKMSNDLEKLRMGINTGDYGQFFKSPQEALSNEWESAKMAAPVFGEALSYAAPVGGAFKAGTPFLKRAVSASLPGLIHGATTPGDLNLIDRGIRSLQEGAVSGLTLGTMGYGKEKLAEGLGRMSLGPGGKKLPEIVREIGQPIKGTAEDIRKNIFEWTAPIREKFTGLLRSSGGKINTAEIFGQPLASEEAGRMATRVTSGIGGEITAAGRSVYPKLVRTGGGLGKGRFKEIVPRAVKGAEKAVSGEGPMFARGPGGEYISLVSKGEKVARRDTGIIGQILDSPGIRTDFNAEEVKNTVQQMEMGFKEQLTKYLERNTNMSSQEILNYVQRGDQNLPLDFWGEYLQHLGSNVAGKWDRIHNMKYVPEQERISSLMYGELKKKILERAGDSGKEVSRLFDLMKASHDIYAHLSKQQYAGTGAADTVKGALSALGLPATAVLAGFKGKPAAAAGSLAVQAARQPRLSAPVSSALSTISPRIPEVIQKIITSQL